MKKIITLILFFTILLASACAPLTDPEETEMPAETENPTGEAPPAEGSYMKSNLERETSPDVTPEELEALARANTAFALSFYDQIRDDDGNIIFSPLSLSLALSMTMAGAETTTEEAMLQALQMALPESEAHAAFNALLLAVEQSQETGAEEAEGSKFQLNIPASDFFSKFLPK